MLHHKNSMRNSFIRWRSHFYFQLLPKCLIIFINSIAEHFPYDLWLFCINLCIERGLYVPTFTFTHPNEWYNLFLVQNLMYPDPQQIIRQHQHLLNLLSLSSANQSMTHLYLYRMLTSMLFAFGRTSLEHEFHHSLICVQIY